MNTAQKFISSKISSMQTIKGCFVEIDNKKIILKTTNLNDFFVTFWPIEEEGTEKVLFDVKKMTEVMGLLEDTEVVLEVEKEKCVLRQGKTVLQFPTFPQDEFPEEPQMEKGDPISLGEANNLSKVTFAASQDETRPVLTGVFFSSFEEKGVLVATDGFRLSLLKTGQAAYSDFILSAGSLSEAIALTKDEKKPEYMYAAKEKLFLVKTEDSRQYTRTIEGEFPAFSKVIPAETATNIKVQRSALQKAIKLVSVFAREQGDVIIWDVKDGEIGLSPKKSTAQAQTVVVAEEVSGPSVKIAFNYKYVLDFLGHCETDEITIGLNQSMSPAVFAEAGNEVFLHVIMPLRTEETMTD